MIMEKRRSAFILRRSLEHIPRNGDDNPTVNRFADGYTVRVDRAEGLFTPLGTVAIGFYVSPGNTTFDSVEPAFEAPGKMTCGVPSC